MLSIPILLGTARNGRYSEHVARYVLEQARQYGFDAQLLDVRDYVTGSATEGALTPEKSAEWLGIMAKADGLIVVSPEYNHGYPGELKMMIDELGDECKRKPLAICGVSSGGMGGVRMTEQLRLVAVDLQLANCKNAVYFSNVEELFNDDGGMKDESFATRLTKQFDELTWWAETLKAGREQK